MRPQDWPALLDGYIEQARPKPFVWGAHDCATFSAGWYALMTGCDSYAPFRGKYASENGAARTMVSFGLDGMLAVGGFMFGPHHERPAFATRGDIVAAADEFGVIGLGVCVGKSGAFLSQAGFRFRPFRNFLAVWSV